MRPILAMSVAIVATGIGGFLVSGPDFRTPALPHISEATAAEHGIATAKEGLRTVSLRVANMSCASCPYIVRRSLENVAGVTSAKVSFRDKTAVVTYDPAKCEVAQLVAATAGVGYPATVKR